MTIEPGQTLLHYRIVDKLGEGGMGVVWRAVDTTLDREVAIKLLPAALGGDPERLARFDPLSTHSAAPASRSKLHTSARRSTALSDFQSGGGGAGFIANSIAGSDYLQEQLAAVRPIEWAISGQSHNYQVAGTSRSLTPTKAE
jgi:serine/threonine protein kinase